MIKQITEPGQIYREYPFLSKEREYAHIEEWKEELNSIPENKKRDIRCFLIFEPDYTFINPEVRNGSFNQMVFVIVPDDDDVTVNRMLRAVVSDLSEEEQKNWPGIKSGGFKTTPFEDVEMAEVCPDEYYEILACSKILYEPRPSVIVVHKNECMYTKQSILGHRVYFNELEGTIENPLKIGLLNSVFEDFMRSFASLKRIKNNMKTVKSYNR